MNDLFPQDIARMSAFEAQAAIRLRSQNSYLGDGLTLSRVLGRHKMLLRTTDRDFAHHLMLDGHWEIWLTLLVARFVKSGMTVIDAGANFGYYSLLLADCVGFGGRVIAVEPNPDTADILARSIELNGFASNCSVVRAALGREASGRAQFFVPEGQPKNASLLHRGEASTKVIEVATTSIDALTRGLDRVDLLKIDVEGAEGEVVDGMGELMGRLRPALILEFNSGRLARPELTLDTLLKVYGSCRSVGWEGELEPITRADVLTRSSREDLLLFFGNEQGLLPSPQQRTAMRWRSGKIQRLASGFGRLRRRFSA